MYVYIYACRSLGSNNGFKIPLNGNNWAVPVVCVFKFTTCVYIYIHELSKRIYVHVLIYIRLQVIGDQ
jgi:hypothetical protein